MTGDQSHYWAHLFELTLTSSGRVPGAFRRLFNVVVVVVFSWLDDESDKCTTVVGILRLSLSQEERKWSLVFLLYITNETE